MFSKFERKGFFESKKCYIMYNVVHYVHKIYYVQENIVSEHFFEGIAETSSGLNGPLTFRWIASPTATFEA